MQTQHLCLSSMVCLNPFRAGRCLSTKRPRGSGIREPISLNPFRAGRCLSTILPCNNRKISSSLNPFRAGRCLSTHYRKTFRKQNRSQSLSSRAMSFDVVSLGSTIGDASSQSLSSRAMSFDRTTRTYSKVDHIVSIPFEQGDVFRHGSDFVITLPYGMSQSLSSRAMSFDEGEVVSFAQLMGLNPFRAGRCLSTKPSSN